ncbi:MAG TPA: Xaa-Pro peptidase family protein [Chthoniobacterales bacterium]
MISEYVYKQVPQTFDRLVRQGEFEEFGEAITDATYHERLQRVKNKVSEDGLDGLFIFADCYRMSNARWLVDYRTIDGVYPQPMLLFVTANDNPIFFLPKSEIESAQRASKMHLFGGDIREIRADLKPLLNEKRGSLKKVGICGYTFMDLEIYLPIREGLPDADIKPSMIVENFKAVKTEAELNSMRRAARCTNAGFQMIYDALEPGITELELTSLCYAAMFANGAHAIAYDIMIQSGENTQVLFRRPTNRVIKDGDIILADVGCRVNDWSADYARTYALGKVKPAHKDLMEKCTIGFEQGLNKIYAGMNGAEADRVIKEEYRKLGVEQYLYEVSEGRTGAHATGMDPEEEVPIIGTAGADQVYVENHTFAYELSLIIPNDVGVRTEDQIVIRKDGMEPLGNFRRYLYK